MKTLTIVSGNKNRTYGEMSHREKDQLYVQARAVEQMKKGLNI